MDIPLSNFHCPPIWGFVGTEKYVDLNHVVYHAEAGNRVSESIDGHSDDYGFAKSVKHKYLRTKLLSINLEINNENIDSEVSKRIEVCTYANIFVDFNLRMLLVII